MMRLGRASQVVMVVTMSLLPMFASAQETSESESAGEPGTIVLVTPARTPLVVRLEQELKVRGFALHTEFAPPTDEIDSDETPDGRRIDATMFILETEQAIEVDFYDSEGDLALERSLDFGEASDSVITRRAVEMLRAGLLERGLESQSSMPEPKSTRSEKVNKSLKVAETESAEGGAQSGPGNTSLPSRDRTSSSSSVSFLGGVTATASPGGFSPLIQAHAEVGWQPTPPFRIAFYIGAPMIPARLNIDAGQISLSALDIRLSTGLDLLPASERWSLILSACAGVGRLLFDPVAAAGYSEKEIVSWVPRIGAQAGAIRFVTDSVGIHARIGVMRDIFPSRIVIDQRTQGRWGGLIGSAALALVVRLGGSER